MSMYVDFVSVMFHLGLNMKKESGNYRCPFCFRKSFTVYPEQKGYYHTNACQWSGDSLQLVCDVKNISRNEAAKELGIALGENYIQLQRANL